MLEHFGQFEPDMFLLMTPSDSQKGLKVEPWWNFQVLLFQVRLLQKCFLKSKRNKLIHGYLLHIENDFLCLILNLMVDIRHEK